MKKLIACAFNMVSSCVELTFSDSSMIAINCTAMENKIADNMYPRAAPNYLIRNAPSAYADFVLTGNTKIYSETVTEYGLLDQIT